MGKYTVTYDLSFVNILLSLFVIMAKMGKCHSPIPPANFGTNPTQSWSGTPPTQRALDAEDPAAFSSISRSVASSFSAPKQSPRLPHRQ